MLDACLPNLAALRLGERDDGGGGDEADIGALTAYDLGHRLSYGPNNIYEGQTWMAATANMNFDPNAGRSEYVAVMEKVVLFAGEQLGDGRKPKYVFLVDGENVWRAFREVRAGQPGGVAGNASTIEQKLERMFNSVIEIEQRDLKTHARLRDNPEWRQPTALFVFTSKHAENNPMDMQPFGQRVESWAQSEFTEMMQWVIEKYMHKFLTVSDQVMTNPRAVACQMHIHVQRCTAESQGPCQDIKKPASGGKSVCYNYDSSDDFRTNPVDRSQYKHEYCEFDDLVVGRLYEAATQILATWAQRAERKLIEIATERELPWRGDMGRVPTNMYNEYSSTHWAEVQQALKDAHVSLPAPTPFMVTRDDGIRYQELHSDPQLQAMLHVNWEWILFAPRVQGFWVRTDHRQDKAWNDWNGYRRELERLSRLMLGVASPTPGEVDASMRRFNNQGLRITVYPGLIDWYIHNQMLYYYAVRPLPPPVGPPSPPPQPLPEVQRDAAAEAQRVDQPPRLY